MKNPQTQVILQDMFIDIKKQYPDSYEKAFQILIQCFSNILKHPKEISYRIIDLINQVIQNNLLIIPEILDALKIIGFSTHSSNNNLLVYQGQSLKVLNDRINILNNLLMKPPKLHKDQYSHKEIHNHPYEERQIHTKLSPQKPQLKQNKYQNYQNIQNNHKIENINNNKVIFFMYDLSEGIAKQLSKPILGKEVEGIWHTAVYVYGREYYYAGGINKSQPRKTKFGIPVKEINFGYTNKTKKEFEEYLMSISKSFTSNNYN